ncbi:Uncharacterized protein PECH_002662 [Penicillium ucsense]|uniref:Uncharacterized protein n=1 Tax=Penicillium ucsense TaxID=2839758 RepID=A0A8J8W7L6_9EURO|nr:Uncharacterized protein PECM_003621 [Penicillium ucsense]KAF7737833.1 Uncharacterized protein PECH_002662 [Penicillium ucsense]
MQGKIRDFFRSRVQFGSSPSKLQDEPQGSGDGPASSPLSDPPRSSTTIDLTADENGQNGQELPVPEAPPGPPSRTSSPDEEQSPTPDQSFVSFGSAPPSSSLNGQLSLSQRILKDGKEVVISSDGEDADSISSLEDPDVLFSTKSKSFDSAPPTAPRNYQPDTALLAQLAKPRKYRNTIDSLVHDAVDDDEIEANVAKAKANYAKLQANAQTGVDGSKKSLNEGMLVSALGGESDEGPNLQRLMDAVRRTEALEQQRAWCFLDQRHVTPGIPNFPVDCFPPGSPLAGLRDPDSRRRIVQSGVLEFAASLQRLPEKFLLWLFQAIPLEPREETRQTFCRILTQTPKERMTSLAGRDAIDGLFRQVGAQPRALKLGDEIVADSLHTPTAKPTADQISGLVSILRLFRGFAAAEQFDEETQADTVLILLRVSIDTSLTSDFVLRSELQATLTALLEFGPKERLEHRICSQLYETVREPQFQSRLLQHILPTSTWVSLLRYRLAVAFLLRDSGPLTEPPELVLDLQRITELLTRDERFRIRRHKDDTDFDYGDLISMTLQLEICLNSALADLASAQGDARSKFDGTIDQLATQIKKIFSSIEDTGASHLQRMLAKQGLEALHYRIVYSVRSKAPPKRTLFSTFHKETNHNVKDMFSRLNNSSATTDGASESAGPERLDGMPMPIRGHDALS